MIGTVLGCGRGASLDAMGDCEKSQKAGSNKIELDRAVLLDCFVPIPSDETSNFQEFL